MYNTFKFLEKYTTFGTIGELWKNKENLSYYGITEFIDNEIYAKKMELLPDLSNIYVLVTNNDFPLQNISTKHCEGMRYTNMSYILGYIQIHLETKTSKTDSTNEFYFIQKMHSRLPTYHITQYMTHSFERAHNFRCTLLPREITIHTRDYWQECFQNEFDIESMDELYKIVTNSGLLDIIQWSGLWTITGKINLNVTE